MISCALIDIFNPPIMKFTYVKPRAYDFRDCAVKKQTMNSVRSMLLRRSKKNLGV